MACISRCEMTDRLLPALPSPEAAHNFVQQIEAGLQNLSLRMSCPPPSGACLLTYRAVVAADEGEAEEQYGATQRGAFEALPDEVTFHIMSLLGGPADLLYSVGMLNTWWRDFVVDDALWKRYLPRVHLLARRCVARSVACRGVAC